MELAAEGHTTLPFGRFFTSNPWLFFSTGIRYDNQGSLVGKRPIHRGKNQTTIFFPSRQFYWPQLQYLRNVEQFMVRSAMRAVNLFYFIASQHACFVLLIAF